MSNINKVTGKETGKKLKAIRKELGLTLNQLSQAVGISAAYVSDFERGRKLPRGNYLRYLAQTHNVNLNYIYSDEKEMFRSRAKPIDFGKFQEEAYKVVKLMADVRPLFWSIQMHVEKYVHDNRIVVEKYLCEKLPPCHIPFRTDSTLVAHGNLLKGRLACTRSAAPLFLCTCLTCPLIPPWLKEQTAKDWLETAKSKDS